MDAHPATGDPQSADLVGAATRDSSSAAAAPYDPSVYTSNDYSTAGTSHLVSHNQSYSHEPQLHDDHPVGIDLQQQQQQRQQQQEQEQQQEQQQLQQLQYQQSGQDDYQPETHNLAHAQLQQSQQSHQSHLSENPQEQQQQQQQQQQQLQESQDQQNQHELLQQQTMLGQPDTELGFPPPQQPQSYKVFCGGLSFQTDEDKLREYFETLGTVVDVVIMRDRTSGHPRGFGFVSFAEESVAKDVASRRHDIDGRQVEAKIAIPRNQVSHPPSGGIRNGPPRHSMDSGGSFGGMGSGVTGTHSSSRSNTSHLNKIFVGGLPSQVGEAEFSAYFSRFGEVTDAQVMIDHQTGNSRGFGFISFADQGTVELVVGPGRSSTRHEIMGKTVEVKRAEPKGSGGGGGGGGDRRARDGYGSVGGQRNHYGGGSHGGLVNMSGVGTNPTNSAAGGAGVSGNAAASNAYAGYNYPASLMEQYGAYYNNPQWQQFYAAMGYNMSAFPQGYNPYSFYAAYMNNANTVGGSGENADSTAAGTNVSSDPASIGGMDGGGQGRASGYGNHGNGSGQGAGPGAGGGAGPGSRRSSRREDRYHPYR